MTPSRQRLAQRRARKARVRALAHPSFTGTLFDIWRHARNLWSLLCDANQTTPVRLAMCEYVTRPEHKKLTDWLCNLERLVRHLVLTAALAIEITLTAFASKAQRKRERARVLIWPDKPHTWRRLRFGVLEHRPDTEAPEKPLSDAYTPRPRFLPSMPLARRLEALRRVLVDPEASARRTAFRLARMAAANARAKQPRRLATSSSAPRTVIPTRGWQLVADTFTTLAPIRDDRVAAWNRGPEPG